MKYPQFTEATKFEPNAALLALEAEFSIQADPRTKQCLKVEKIPRLNISQRSDLIYLSQVCHLDTQENQHSMELITLLEKNKFLPYNYDKILFAISFGHVLIELLFY